MNRCLTLSVAISVTLSTLAIPVRAANKPRAGTDSHNAMVWTNNDVEKLHDLGLISIVGRMNEETPKPASLPQPYVKTQDAGGDAEQAAKLREELERSQAQLGGYRHAREDAQSLRGARRGINTWERDITITPE